MIEKRIMYEIERLYNIPMNVPPKSHVMPKVALKIPKTKPRFAIGIILTTAAFIIVS